MSSFSITFRHRPSSARLGYDWTTTGKVTQTLTTCTPSIRSVWDATKIPKPSLNPCREPRDPTVAPPISNAPESFRIPSEPNVLHPGATIPQRPFPTPGDVLVMGSHVLQHLDRGEPALPSTAESPGGLGSPYRPVQHNPGTGGARCPCPPGDNPPTGLARMQSPPLLLGKLPAAWRALQEADSEKMAAASAEEGEQGGNGLFKP